MIYPKLSEIVKEKQPYTALFYCNSGVGKTTMAGLIAEKSKGNTLILDVDRTIATSLGKGEIVKDISRIEKEQISNVPKIVDKETGKVLEDGTWDDWAKHLNQLAQLKETGKLNYENIVIDNISELERCLLSDLGSQGKNKNTPSQGDYLHVQFNMMNSLRFLKSLGVNLILTAWETYQEKTMDDGTQFLRSVPQISAKILDNVCGLCDIVGKIAVKKDGTRGIYLEARQDLYAKNQIDNRKGCLVEEFI